MLCLSGWLIAAVALMGCAETAAFQQTFTGGSLSLIPPRATVAIFSGSRRCDFVKAAAMREGNFFFKSSLYSRPPADCRAAATHPVRAYVNSRQHGAKGRAWSQR